MDDNVEFTQEKEQEDADKPLIDPNRQRSYSPLVNHLIDKKVVKNQTQAKWVWYGFIIVCFALTVVFLYVGYEQKERFTEEEYGSY